MRSSSVKTTHLRPALGQRLSRLGVALTVLLLQMGTVGCDQQNATMRLPAVNE